MVVSILEMLSSSSDLERYILDMVVSNSSKFLSNFERDMQYYLKHLVMLIDILESKKSFCPKIVSPLLYVKPNAAQLLDGKDYVNTIEFVSDLVVLLMKIWQYASPNPNGNLETAATWFSSELKKSSLLQRLPQVAFTCTACNQEFHPKSIFGFKE